MIGENGEGKIYRVGADGSVVATWGWRGEGPGEYQGLEAILLRGDSILVSDGRLRRVTLLGPDGEVRTAPLPAGTILPTVSAILEDGRLLLLPGEAYWAAAEMRPEWVFETNPILAAPLGGATVDTLADLPHFRRWYGTLVGWVPLAGAIAVLDITDDRILAVRRNELDVPAVVMIELIKS